MTRMCGPSDSDVVGCIFSAPGSAPSAAGVRTPTTPRAGSGSGPRNPAPSGPGLGQIIRVRHGQRETRLGVWFQPGPASQAGPVSELKLGTLVVAQPVS